MKSSKQTSTNRWAREHVPANIWADIATGRAAPDIVGDAKEHRATCDACDRAGANVELAVRGLKSARSMELPEQFRSDGAAESMGGQIAWRIAQDRQKQSTQRLRFVWLSGFAAAAAGIALFVSGRADTESKVIEKPAVAEIKRPSATPSATSPRATQPKAAQLSVIATLAERDVEVATVSALPVAYVRMAAHELLAKRIAAGTRIRTGEGRAVFAMERATGFALSPSSEALIQRAESNAIDIELLNGRILFDAEAREENQTLTVLANEQRVTAHGARFAVERSGTTLRVSVLRGRVVVAGSVETTPVTIDAGVMAELTLAQDNSNSATKHMGALTEDEQSRLDEPLPLPVANTNAPRGDVGDLLADSTGIASLRANSAASIAVDGLYVGRSGVSVRLSRGRHLITAATPGEGQIERWIDIVADSKPTEVRLERERASNTAAEKVISKSSGAQAADRGVELDRLARSAKGAIRACYTTGVEKRSELSGTVTLQFDIASDGHLAPVAIASSTLNDADVERCLKKVVQSWKFGPGERSTVLFPLELKQQ